MLKPVELPADVNLRLMRTGVAEGPDGETMMLTVTVPTKLFKLVKWIDEVWLF
jgi:hypothetical protein